MFERTQIINRQTKNNTNMRISKSKLLGLFIATILLTSLISYVAFSNPSISYTTVIQEGSMNTVASYIIFKDDSTYYARNGETGEITSGTNASLIISNVFSAVTKGTIFFKQALYELDHQITLHSNLELVAEQGTILKAIDQTYKRDIFDVADNGDLGISNVTISGFIFDENNITESAIRLMGNDTSVCSNIRIRGNTFVNPGNRWRVQVNYGLIDSLPGSYNRDIWIENNVFDLTDQTLSYEGVIVTNSRNVRITGNTFKNAPSNIASSLALYGYVKDAIISHNNFENNYKDMYVQQSRNITICANTFSSTLQNIIIYNSELLSITSNSMATSSVSGINVYIADHAGTTFDADHPNIVLGSNNITIANNQLRGDTGVKITTVNRGGQNSIHVIGNQFTKGTYFFGVINTQAENVYALTILSNHIATQNSSGNGCIYIIANSQYDINDVIVQNNYISASTVGGTRYSIEVTNAQRVAIQNNVYYDALNIVTCDSVTQTDNVDW